MDLDEQTFKKLLDTFQIELEERLQEITEGILQLEKKDFNTEEKTNIFDKIFRAAHNIKGTARTLGIKTVGEIAHHIESLFAKIQKNEITLQSVTIDLCLEGVDCIRSAMQSFVEKQPLRFDLDFLLQSLDKNTSLSKADISIASTSNMSLNQRGYETIRVSIENLDRISAILEEVQIAKIVLDDHYTELTKATTLAKQLSNHWRQLNPALQSKTMDVAFGKMYSGSHDELTELRYMLEQLHRNMRSSINNLAILSNTMEEEVRTLRLTPASILLQSLPRVVRDIAHELQKKVIFEYTGETVKIDKMVLEGLQNPIIHLLRNAIDHGIESPDVRSAKGKSEAGHIQLDIREDGDHICIAIADDGAGIDANKIGAQIVHKKLLTQIDLDHLKPEEIIDYIFYPGFSTKEIITDVSGRGVGLDVVKSNLLDLKGQVSVKTEVGKGTVFTMRVPLTLASERGLLVNANGHLFVLPTNLIDRVLSLPLSDIKEVEASQVIVLNEQAIPLKNLTDILGMQQSAVLNRDKLSLIVIKKNQQSIALHVDHIIGEREIVIKPLLPPLVNIPCVVGGTLAGNGQVMIVLNTSDLIDRSQQIEKMMNISLEGQSTHVETRPHILVVDDSITTRTLEKNILESRDYHVTTAVNGKEAWDILQNKKFSLLITDVMMPIMDGFALTERVKQSKELADLPVIIVTSLGSEAEKARGVQVGANAYIVKNEFESEKLLEIVEQLV